MKEQQPTDYFFIHFIEDENDPTDGSDFVRLNGCGYLYIGYAEWTENHEIGDNTYFSLDEVRAALKQIQKALKTSHRKAKVKYPNHFQSL